MSLLEPERVLEKRGTVQLNAAKISTSQGIKYKGWTDLQRCCFLSEPRMKTWWVRYLNFVVLCRCRTPDDPNDPQRSSSRIKQKARSASGWNLGSNAWTCYVQARSEVLVSVKSKATSALGGMCSLRLKVNGSGAKGNMFKLHHQSAMYTTAVIWHRPSPRLPDHSSPLFPQTFPAKHQKVYVSGV